MKKLFIALFALASSLTLAAQSRSDYDLVVSMFQEYYNHQQTESMYNLFSDKLKTLMPLEKTKQTFGPLYLKFGDLNSFTFQSEKEGYTFYKTDFANVELTLIVQLNKDNKIEVFRFLPYQPDTAKSNYNLKTGTGTIYGTLSMPKASSKVPVVLIIAGSGPTDRNCNNILIGKTNAYLMIADSLQKAGIACVRYDKRGVGESTGALKDEAALRFEDIVNDAAGYIKMLKADSRFSKVYVLGHSEGSLIGMLAMQKEKADGFISVAGAADPADKLIERQYASQSLELAEKVTTMFDSLKQGYTLKNVSDELSSLFRESVQPYIRGWIKHDPAKEIEKIKEPALILQGTTDLQVGINQAKLLKQGCSQAELRVISGMNHVLKQAPGDKAANVATYSNPDLPLCSGFMDAIVRFAGSN